MSIQETPLDGRRKDATKNRELLLRAARAAIAENAAASLDTIAQAAGLTRRAVYGHFPDRDALVREVIADGAREFDAIAEGDALSSDARLALAQLATGLWRAQLTVRASVNIASVEQYRRESAEAFAALRKRLSTVTLEGIDSGTLRADLAADVLALLIEEAAKAALRDDRVVAGADATTVIKVVLSIAGLSWREQESLLGSHPEVVTGAS
ncbi:TetR family transcriptional regulator [Leucobacter komagatae]|uniref:TetR family transcriptional regulator n=1 Tax=Leucobacter komagatae TaxID=55969 RepID=A0A542Y5S2_9MICO|nr:TetR/AcrR family transcriptional regulator [Leucobacter komagatae]TQL43403.1 TetR family transcriptional regulator [Leucobacter komagatae]